MSCHGCGHEDADACTNRDVHIPSNHKQCQNCIRNPTAHARAHPPILRFEPSPLELTDNYVEAADLAEMISKEAFLRIVKNQLRLGERTVGWIFKTADGKRILRTTRNRKKHFMRIFKAWGMSKAVLHFLKESNFDGIQIHIGKTEFLNSNLQDWFTHGIESKFRGFETQLFLAEKHMKPEKQRVWDLPK